MILNNLGCVMHWERIPTRQIQMEKHRNFSCLEFKSIVFAFWLEESGWTLIKGEEIEVIVNSLSDRFDVIRQKFTGDWRKGQEIKKVVVTKRLYQVSVNYSQAWFSNWLNLLKEIFNEIRFSMKLVLLRISEYQTSLLFEFTLKVITRRNFYGILICPVLSRYASNMMVLDVYHKRLCLQRKVTQLYHSKM